MDANTKRFLTNQLMWIGIYFGIALVVSIFIDFPYSFIVLIAIILGISYYRRRRMGRGMGGGFFGMGNRGGGGGMFGERGIDYYCMNCGTKHSQVSCPNCGSKLKKAGF